MRVSEEARSGCFQISPGSYAMPFLVNVAMEAGYFCMRGNTRLSEADKP
jgi:hypothetical protein